MKEKKSSLTFSILLVAIFSTLSSPMKAATQNSEKVQAQQIIEKARKAIFGSTTVRGLSLTWKNRLYFKQTGKQDMSVSNIDLLLPDKMFMKEVRDFSGNSGQLTIIRLLNGNQSWKDMRSSNSENLVLKSSEDDDPVKRLQSVRRDQALQFLQLMLPSSSDFPLIFSYVGRAKANDGEADVINVKGPDAFSAQIFIDRITYRLLMVMYTLPGTTGLTVNQRDLKKGGLGMTPLGQVDVKIRYLEYRQENGVTLPHLITQEQNGSITKEAELSSFKLNPTFAPDYFDLNKKRR
jgi:hypothetical protein